MTPLRGRAPLPCVSVAARCTAIFTVAAASLTVVALAGCSGGGRQQAQAAAAATPAPLGTPSDTSPGASTTVGATSTSTTVAPEANLPPDTTVAGTATLGRGSKGPAVQAVEQRLADLRFDPGNVDGIWDYATEEAVVAFQKQAALPRTGRADEATRARLAGAPFGVPMATSGTEPSRVEVDLQRQMLQVWHDNKLLRVIGVSSGTGLHYCDKSVLTGKQVCDVATTPTGMFHFEHHIAGEHKSDLGTLYDPVFFTGGYAVHGSPSVPASPASHGCIRIPMRLSKWFYDNVAVGTQIFVLKGNTPPLPPSAPVDVPPTSTTTTVVPPTTAPPTSTTAKPTTSTTRPAATTTSQPPTTSTTTSTTTTTTHVP